MIQSHEMTITPRPVCIDFPADTSRYWFNNSPFISHFFDAFSTTLPVGEDLFIFSLRQLRDKVDDPVLQKQISGFIGQEAFHSREHAKYNQLIREWGYDLDKMDRSIQRGTRIIRARLSPIQALAVTLSCEHITSILSAALLRDDLMAQADPNVRALWQWHAVEEIEHKAVAWDVYRYLGGTYRTRVICMNLAIMMLGIRISARTLHMLRKDKLLFNVGVWREGLRFLWGRQGLLRKLRRDFLDFYKRSFHPWDHQTLPLTEAWKKHYQQKANT